MVKTKLIDGYPFISYYKESFSAIDMINRSNQFYEWMEMRRSATEIFQTIPYPKEVIKKIILSASTAPSGAHKQPWTFCVVSDSAIKKQIRIEAEKEELESYSGRIPEDWLQDLRPLQTDWKKDF